MDNTYSMDQLFLDKVKDAIQNNFADDSFSVDELAHEVGISRSQLHRKLQALNQSSAHQLIKEYRLEKAHEMLADNIATVSEIAYKVGFKSPSYFNTCFHEFFGYPPGKVRMRKTGGKSPRFSSISKKHIAIFLIIVLGSVAIALYSVIKRSSAKSTEILTERSIGIIPFKNLSEDPENMHFADGITDDILNHLSGIKGIEVKSRQSSEKYRQSDKSSIAIGKELSVSYLLEGSVQRYEDKIRVIVQLIDASNDVHIWAESYDREFKDIFAIQSEISRNVAVKLNIAITENTLNHIDKEPTTNLEAYSLYLKGRYHWNRRTEEGLNQCIEYYNQSLILDPDYALAYAGLADAYFILTWWNWMSSEGYKMAREHAEKALALDSNLAQAHAVLAGIKMYSDWDWEGAKNEVLVAISLNPNYVTAYHYYSELLDIQGQNEQARKMIDKAISLDPYSIILSILSSMYYYHSDDCNSVINESIGLLHVHYYNPVMFRLIECYLKTGDENEAIQAIKRVVVNSDPDANLEAMDKASLESGGDSALTWFVNWMINFKSDDEYFTNSKNYYIASFKAFQKDKNGAIEYLKRSISLKEGAVPRINNNPDFDFMRDDEDFEKLLKEMGLY